MLKKLCIRVFYRLFFTVWVSALSAIGAENGISFFLALTIGGIIDLYRYKYVPHTLSKASDGLDQRNIFFRLFSFKKNGSVTTATVLVSYIWIICILDMYVPNELMAFYYELFKPLHYIASSQVEFVRTHTQDLISHGYESRVLLTQHLYSVGIVGWIVGLVIYCCFYAHKVIAPWKSNNCGNTPDPLTFVPNITFLLLFMIALWFGWGSSQTIDFTYDPEKRFVYRIHDNNLGFMFSYSMIIFLLNIFSNATFHFLLSARNRLSP